LSGTVSWRTAQKSDRPLLERFECTNDDGPDYERIVQRYFRVQAIPHLGAPDSIRADHRLLFVFDEDRLVAAGCHRRGPGPGQRHFVYAAVARDRQGRELSNGERASRVLWAVVSNDIIDREGGEETLVFSRVHPENARSLAYCSRIGLTPLEQDSRGLVICAGPIARA